MSQVGESGASGVDRAFDFFEAVLPQWLDYKRGYDPNSVYGYSAQQQGYLFAPRGTQAADLALSAQIFGQPVVGGLSLGAIALLALGAFVVSRYV